MENLEKPSPLPSPGAIFDTEKPAVLVRPPPPERIPSSEALGQFDTLGDKPTTQIPEKHPAFSKLSQSTPDFGRRRGSIGSRDLQPRTDRQPPSPIQLSPRQSKAVDIRPKISRDLSDSPEVIFTDIVEQQIGPEEIGLPVRKAALSRAKRIPNSLPDIPSKPVVEDPSVPTGWVLKRSPAPPKEDEDRF